MFRHKLIGIMVLCLLPIIFLSVSVSNEISILPKQKQIEVEGMVSKELGKYPELQGAIEFLACAEGGKSYESMFVLRCEPRDLYDALIKIGLKPGAPAYDDESGKHIPPKGDKVRILVEWKSMKFRAENLIYNKKTGKTMQYVDWVFTGSKLIEDPETNEKVLQADLTRSIVSTHHGDRTVILQNPLSEATDESIYRVNDRLLPEPGTKVKFIIDASPSIQLHVFIAGKVQGVGFRNFTKQVADQMGVCGYAKNLADGRVEVLLEGTEYSINGLLEKLRVGPEPAEVKDVKTEKRRFTGKYKDFQIHQ